MSLQLIIMTNSLLKEQCHSCCVRALPLSLLLSALVFASHGDRWNPMYLALVGYILLGKPTQLCKLHVRYSCRSFTTATYTACRLLLDQPPQLCTLHDAFPVHAVYN